MILIVDDDYSVTASLALLLKQAGHATRAAPDPPAALAALEAEPAIALVLQDMNFSRSTTGEEGLALLRAIKVRRPGLPVILITAWGSIDLAVKGMKAGAADFVTKPWNDAQVLGAVATALDLAAAGTETGGATRAELEARLDLAGIVGEDPGFLELLRLAGRVAPTEAPVLVTGDSGTGKELVARALHRNSPRAGGPFVSVNLGGVPPALFESELFGHVRGAFTDAHRDREGRFAAAEGGTIFLDEIGDLEAGCQVKLLRVLQERTYEPLGSSRTRRLDARVVSATNKDLAREAAAGRFREDLLYRLNLIVLRLPALAERPGDIAPLAEHFLTEAGRIYDKPGVRLGASGRRWLAGREWPGNVRQLRHLIVRSLLIADADPLEAADLERVARLEAGEAAGDALPAVGAMTLAEIERGMIVKSLAYHDGNISRVAESLGLSRAALYRRLEKYGIQA